MDGQEWRWIWNKTGDCDYCGWTSTEKDEGMVYMPSVGYFCTVGCLEDLILESRED